MTSLIQQFLDQSGRAIAIAIVIMSSKYVCRQCTRLLRDASTASKSIASSSARRWHSSNAIKKPASPSTTLTRNVSTSYSSSSTASSNQDAPGMAAVPPGRQYQHHNQDQRSNQLLQRNNLFHSFSQSPSPAIRKRAAYIKQHAYCPHPSHRQTRQPEGPHDAEAKKSTSAAPLAPAHVKHECPDCGIPVYCCEEHWADDYENHLEICDTLRQINEDDHDLRSGRSFSEFVYPGSQMEELLVNMTNWDTYLYTREFEAINDERSLRQATKLVTYPATIGSVLHELSPYGVRNRLTPEGLRSFSGK